MILLSRQLSLSPCSAFTLHCLSFWYFTYGVTSHTVLRLYIGRGQVYARPEWSRHRPPGGVHFCCYGVKRKSFKMLRLLYHLTKLSTDNSKYTNHEFTKLRHCWTFGAAFNRVQVIAQLMESSPSRLRTGQRTTF